MPTIKKWISKTKKILIFFNEMNIKIKNMIKKNLEIKESELFIIKRSEKMNNAFLYN